MTATDTSAEIPEAPEISEAEEYAHDATDLEYVQVAAILALVTVAEVMTYFVDIGDWLLPSLMVMMVVKFALVVLFFMHLRFDAALLKRTFVFGLVVALAVYTVALTVMNIWTDNGNPWYDDPPPAITTTTVAEGG